MMLPVNQLHQAIKKALVAKASNTVYYKLLTGSLLLPSISLAAPTGGQVTDGTASIHQLGANTTINQTSQQVDIQWNGFNVAAGEKVQFNQPNSQSLAVNRISDTNGTQIHGQIQANGQVWLINPNGVLFGQNAQINVGALTASTLNPGRPIGGSSQTFSGSGEVINQGQITASGGYVALLGSKVVNEGSINADQGTVALGAGSQVSLHFDNNGQLTDLTVDKSELNALVENRQAIIADGGQVLMSAGARNSLLASQVNNSGLVQARTVANKDGRIILLSGMEAGTTKVAGTLDASAPNGGDGGFIETSGAKVNKQANAHITTLASNGKTGTWLIDPVDYRIAASEGDITGAELSTDLATTNVTISSVEGSSGTEGNLIVDDGISWNAPTELTLVADKDITINAAITSSHSLGKLHLKYAQADNSGSYFLKAPINIQKGNNYSTQKGTNPADIINYYVITELGLEGSRTGTDLQGIIFDLDKNYALGSNIDASSTASWTNGFESIKDGSNAFNGNFDGLGHTITDLKIKISSSSTGLFGITSSGKTIQNIGLINTSMSSAGSSHKQHDVIGSLVGNNKASICNSYSHGVEIDYQHIEANSIGGLVGNHAVGVISDSNAQGNIRGGFIVGGLAGGINGKVYNSYSSGNVFASKWNVGGLTGGTNSSSVIENSYSTANVESTKSGAGGLVGRHNSGKIINSYSTGNITSGKTQVGGLVGNLVGGSITNSYSISKVKSNNSSSSVGALAGTKAASASINNSFALDQNGVSLIGSGNKTISNTDLLSAEEIKDVNVLKNYLDISANGADNTAWRIYDGKTTPLLRELLTPLKLSDSQYTYTGLEQQLTINNPGIDSSLIFGTSSSATDAGDYHHANNFYSSQQGYDISGYFTINKKAIHISGSKVYDGNGNLAANSADITLSIGGTVNNETLTLSGLGTVVSADVDAQSQTLNTTGLSINDGIGANAGKASNYTFTGGNHSASIEAKAIDISGSKVYDATGTFIVDNLSYGTSTINGETLTLTGTASVSSADVNAGSQTLDLTGLSFTNGTGKASNYTFTDGNHSASIKAKAIDISGSKAYDATGTLTADHLSYGNSTVNGETLTLTGTASVSSADVDAGSQTLDLTRLSFTNGTGKASNYTFTDGNHSASIEARAIDISGSKVYDANGTLTADHLSYGNSTVNGETLTLAGTASVASADVDTGNQTLDLTGLSFTNSTGKASNYTFTGGTHSAFIKAKAIDVSGSKVYDANGTFTVDNLSVGNTVNGQTLTLVGTASLISADVETGNQTLDLTGLSFTNGTGKASNYTFTSGSHSAFVTTKTLSLTGSRTYDGSLTVSTDNLSLQGVITGENLNLEGSANSINKNAGTHGLDSSWLSLTDGANGKASNYQLASTPTDHTFTITPRLVNPVATAAEFTGQQTAELTSLTANGFIIGDNVALGHTNASFVTTANGVELQVNGITLTGEQAANYQLASNSFSSFAAVAEPQANNIQDEISPDRVQKELAATQISSVFNEPEEQFYELENQGFKLPNLSEEELEELVLRATNNNES